MTAPLRYMTISTADPERMIGKSDDRTLVQLFLLMSVSMDCDPISYSSLANRTSPWDFSLGEVDDSQANTLIKSHQERRVIG